MAESGRSCAVEYLGEISNDPVAIGRLCDRLERPSKTLAFCYEAGPCGYGVHRHLISLGHRCDVVAPSLIPTRPGDRAAHDLSHDTPQTDQIAHGFVIGIRDPDGRVGRTLERGP